MIRCRRCNAELIEQTHLCNVCGLPQKPSEPELGKTTPTKQKTPNLYSTNRCVNCATQLPDEAHFCAVCGVTQTAKKSSVIQTTYGEQVKSASTSENHESSTVYLQPSMSLKPSRSIQPINKQLSIESDHLPNPPVYPNGNYFLSERKYLKHSDSYTRRACRTCSLSWVYTTSHKISYPFCYLFPTRLRWTDTFNTTIKTNTPSSSLLNTYATNKGFSVYKTTSSTVFRLFVHTARLTTADC